MRIKIILANIILLPSILFGMQMGFLNKSGNNLEERIINKNIEVGNNSNKKYSQDNLNFYGKNYGRDYRVFLDFSNDKNLPKIPESIDYLIGKGNKDEWYEHLIQGIEINVLNYASNKDQFLKQYGAINIKYEYMFNFWNSKDGWTYPQGKRHSYSTWGYTYVLKGKNSTEKIIEKTDSNHKSNERARIILYEEWNENYLKIKMHLGVWYHWAWGSIYHHATLAQFKNDEYTFINTNGEGNLKQQVATTFSSFTINNSSEVTGLSNIDKVLKQTSTNFGMTTLTVQQFMGIKIVLPYIYYVYVSIIWFPNSLVNLDGTFILNGIPISRKIYSKTFGNTQYFEYKNNLGKVERTNSVIIDPNIRNTIMTGITSSFFIYN